MRITVQLFAQARDLAGAPRIELELGITATIGDLRAALVGARPPLATIARTLLVAVNGEYAADTTSVPEGAEVACFPPVSGG